MQSQSTPQILYDVNHKFGQDIQSAANGDLGLVSGAQRSQQRVLRRLLTAINSYIWHIEYGAGLSSFVGQPLSSDNYDQIKSLILSNMFNEQSVSQTPPPVITIQNIGNAIAVQINYTENPTQNPIVLNFDLGT